MDSLIFIFLMFDLYLLNEIGTNSLSYDFLNVISFISIFSSIFVIVSKNPIVSVLFLILLFISIAGYLMMLGINFIGLSYLLVYVGAVSILFLFILMLINVRISELVANSSNSIPLAIMIGLIFGFIQLFPSGVPVETYKAEFSHAQTRSTWYNINDMLSNFNFFNDNKLSFVSSHLWDGRLAESFHITSIGNVIYTNYPLWLIITSIILLLAMIGSILITIKQ